MLNDQPSHIASVGTPVDTATIESIVELREEIRDDEGGGGRCHHVADALESLYGWPRMSGTYTSPLGEVICSAHVWNVLPGGWMLDATVDQFGETGEVLILGSGKADIRRYRLE
jgi:hypothetical protein